MNSLYFSDPFLKFFSRRLEVNHALIFVVIQNADGDYLPGKRRETQSAFQFFQRFNIFLFAFGIFFYPLGKNISGGRIKLVKIFPDSFYVKNKFRHYCVYIISETKNMPNKNRPAQKRDGFLKLARR